MSDNKSYKQIIKSTSIFGGSQIINIFIGFIRTKIIAVLLGATGIGLIGIYQSITEMVRSFAMLGVDTSGIKDVATANNTGNKKIINESVAILRKWMFSLSIFGALFCVIFSYPIAIWAFGEDNIGIHVCAVASLSLYILFSMLSAGRSSVMQGLRKIPEMVKSNVSGNFLALLVSIPLYFLFGVNAIIPSLILSSIILFICTVYFSRNIGIEDVHISMKHAYNRGRSMFKMGVFIVSASICQTASMFILRAFISQRIGIEGVGIFTASWTITNVYLALVLRSMGSDFYPRLCGVVSSNIRTRRLVNEQTHIILIVASPIIIGMLLAADYIIPILYSSRFLEASSLLQWQVAATFLKVISWPMGFILLAKGKGKLFFFSEFLFFLIYLGSSYILFPYYGLEGTGMGYLIAYVAYLITLIAMTIRVSNFKWRMSIIKLSIIYLLLISVSFYAANSLHNPFIGTMLFLIACSISIWKFNAIIPLKSLVKRFQKK